MERLYWCASAKTLAPTRYHTKVLAGTVANLSTVHVILLIALALACIWFASELAYSYGRYARFDNGGNEEHIDFGDVISFHAPVWVMSGIRLLMVITLATLTM